LIARERTLYVVSLSTTTFVAHLVKNPFVVSLSNHAFRAMQNQKNSTENAKSVVRQPHHERAL